MNKILITILLIILTTFIPVSSANAQDDPKAGELAVLMDNMIGQVTALERAYNPSIASNIARTMRLDVYTDLFPELERYRQLVEGRADLNSIRLRTLLDATNSLEITDLSTLPVLEEILVRSMVLDCENRGISPQTVSQYVLTGYSTFVTDHGDFSNPDFDMETLSGEDLSRIYFNGFGLMVLINMDPAGGSGVREAVRLYESTPHMKGFLGNQFVIRGVDLDINGIPLLQAVLDDDEVIPDIKEIYYGVMAEKIAVGVDIFGSELNLSDEWYNTIEPWVAGHVLIPDRLTARESVGFPYGVSFGYMSYGPESLLGMCGKHAADDITAMLTSDALMKQIAGLEAIRRFDKSAFPDEASRILGFAEPLMASIDFATAMLALEAFDRDAKYSGTHYEGAQMNRISANIPIMCDLMQRAKEVEWVDYVYSTSWWDIFQEGSLTGDLEPCLPMIITVVNADWAVKISGEDLYFPSSEVEILTYFIPTHNECFTETSDAVRGFLTDELDRGTINQFTVWGYVDYLRAADDGGIALDDEWLGTILRVKQWVSGQSVLIRGEELTAMLEQLLW